jgi:hypothetical protein
MWDDDVPTLTSDDQQALERRVRALYGELNIVEANARLILDRDAHANYLRDGLGELPAGK